MRAKSLLVALTLSLAAILWQTGFNTLRAQSPTSAALTGQVSSKEEGNMEGVLVSAKKDGSTVAVTVVSDKQGRYSFPREKLEPGQYSLKIRAVGYELDGSATVEITAQKTASADIKLRPVKDIALQLTNAEWLMSMPGPEERKNTMLACTSCHTYQRIVRSQHDADEFVQVMARMASYAPGSSPLKPQRRVALREGDGNNLARFRKQAEFLASINLSAVSRWEYQLKTLPRATGRATRVIITEYDLPRPVAQPHDVIMDSEGTVWYSDFGSQFIGKLDPKTGKVTEYPTPELKPGFPQGGLDIELDKAGNVWLGMMLQGGILKFDPKTEKFQTFGLTKDINSDVAQQAMVMPTRYDVDGKVWMNNVGLRGIHRLELASGKFETFEPYRGMSASANDVGGMEGGGHSVYGIAADSHNNLFFMDFGDQNIGKIDAKTGKITLFPTPTPNSHPRRGHMDSQDRLWFAEAVGNKIAMFDTKTEKFQEWALPTKWSYPYDVIFDKNGEVWTGGMTTDRVVRLDPKSGQVTEYSLPRDTNIRRVFVDNSTTPVTFWVGSDHGASIVKVQPLD